MATAPIGSTERTNQLLAEASQTTGIAAPTFPITSTSLTPTPTPTIPAYTPPVPQSYESIAAQNMTPATTEPVTGDTSKILSRIKALSDAQGQKSAVQGTLETGAGIPDLNKQLNEINAQIGSYTAQAKQFQTNQEDRQAPTFAILGSQAAAERQLSAKTFGLAAAAQALQGNIALANDNVKRALAAQFDPLESQIKYQETLLNLNQNNLSKADKAKADLANARLQDRKDALAAQKEEQGKIYDVYIKAAANRASNTLLQQIQSAPTYAEALKLAGSAGALATPKAPLQGDITRLQTNDVASAVIDFQNQIQQKGWLGANPDAYQYYRTELAAKYGAAAALALDKAMADAGITVDYTNK